MLATKLDSLRLGFRRHTRALEWALRTRAGMELHDLSHVRVRLRTLGSGRPPVVFLADPPNVVEHYDRLFELLSPRFRVICLDTPGCGFSYPKPTYTYALDAQVQVLTELLERIDRGPYLLALSCTSAYAAIVLSARRPDLVAGLISIQAASLGEEARWARRIDPLGLICTPVLGQLLLASAPQRLARTWYGAALPSAERAGAFLEPSLDALRHGACFGLGSMFQQLRSCRLQLPAVSAPAIVLWGTADRAHRRTDKSTSREHFPAAQWTEFQQSGHFPELEEPERFAGLVEAFVSG